MNCIKKSNRVRYKLISSFVLLIVIPICLITTIQYIYSKQLIERQTEEYLEDVVEWSSTKINDFVKEIEDISFSLISNDNIQNILLRKSDEAEGKFDKYLRVESMKQQLSSYALLRSYISAIAIYAEDGQRYVYSKNRSYDVLTEEEIQQIYMDKKETVRFTNKIGREKIIVTRPINTFANSKSLGYVAITIEEGYINEMFSLFSKINQGRILLADETGAIISSYDKELIGVSVYVEQQIIKDYMESLYHMPYSVYTSLRMDNKWTIIAAIPSSYISKNIDNLRSIFYMVAIFFSMIAVIIAIRLSNSITKPLTVLARQMNRFGEGDFSVRYDMNSNDEFRVLGDTFNQMVVRIEELLKVVYKEKYLKKKAELQSLQMQINPHFLYNTLETLNWMARLKGVDEIGDMVTSLGNIMRFALGKNAYVTLRQEMRSVEDYLKIQKFRYGERLKTVIDVPDELLNYQIPKLLIQPILENAIVYSVEGKIGISIIRIWLEKENEDLYIRIKDNGIGMSDEAIKIILFTEDKIEKSRGSNIGIRNVNNRLKMHYGEGYGVEIQSKLDRETEVVLKLKAILE